MYTDVQQVSIWFLEQPVVAGVTQLRFTVTEGQGFPGRVQQEFGVQRLKHNPYVCSLRHQSVAKSIYILQY